MSPQKDNDCGDDDPPASFASPPCFMHELDPEYSGLLHPVDNRQQVDVTRWRKAERERLILKRQALSTKQRQAFSQRIATHLDRIIGNPAGLVISVYWPIRGEPDLRDWIERITDRNGLCALPVIVGKTQPLSFQRWSPGQPLQCGVLNIKVPKTDENVQPDIVIVPVLGFDSHCHRLGYGGGFYDRTLAILSPTPRILGVSYAGSKVTTIYPQPHDIAMDMIVTEAGVSLPHEN